MMWASLHDIESVMHTAIDKLKAFSSEDLTTGVY